MRYPTTAGGKWVSAAQHALEFLGRPANIGEIMSVIDNQNLLIHNSQQAEQTLRNEIRKSCERTSHPQGYPTKHFYQPYRGYYGLATAEYAQVDGSWPSPTRRAAAESMAVRATCAAQEQAATKEVLNQSIVGEDEQSRFPEGKAKYLIHRRLERDTGLAKKAKIRRLQRDGSLSCDVCTFSFSNTYGDFAQHYIEAHHTIPVSQLRGNSHPRIRDLALVCSNCHRMLHLKRPWLTIAQLKTRIRKQAELLANQTPVS